MRGGVGYDLLSLSTGVEIMSAQNQMFVTITSASQLKSKPFLKKNSQRHQNPLRQSPYLL